MNETQTKILSYWKEIVIVFLLIVSIIFWQSSQNSKKDLEEIKGQIALQDTLDKLNSKLKDIEDREKNLYPKIDAEVAKLNKNISDLQKLKDWYDKNKPKKEDTENDINKLNLNEISKRFTDLGYSNTINPSPK